MSYVDENAKAIDSWNKDGWTWGIPIDHKTYVNALNGKWDMLLTPTKSVPKKWYPENLKGVKVLGLASGGGQQMPIFAALGAECIILDYSPSQLESERMVAEREGYDIRIIKADMSKPLPFESEEFDLIFHPVATCYIEEVKPLFKECYRILKRGGIFLGGFDNGINYISKDELTITEQFPFNPLKNPEQMEFLRKEDAGVQFSHTAEEVIGGLLEAGLTLTHLYEDTNGEGRLHELNIPTFIAVRCVK